MYMCIGVTTVYVYISYAVFCSVNDVRGLFRLVFRLYGVPCVLLEAVARIPLMLLHGGSINVVPLLRPGPPTLTVMPSGRRLVACLCLFCFPTCSYSFSF